ncbi:ribonuclease H-like domain-containing protein [Tanacetum coccineum]
MVEKPIWNNARRVNQQNSQRLSHPHSKRNFVPSVVLIKYGLKTLNTVRQHSSRAAISVNTARPINTASTKATMNCAKPASNVFTKAHLQVGRPFNKFTTSKNSNFTQKVNSVRGNVTIVRRKAVVSDSKGNEANAVKASACWVWRPKQKVLDHISRNNGASMNFKRFDYIDAQELQEKGVIDSGCSMHMTRNMSYLSEYEEFDGGYVAFRGDPKGVLLRVPRKNNTYSVNLKNIASLGGLTYLFAKATLDESTLCHRRLGHINFKTMNKLMRGNLFCEMKGIKREFSVARTPQQNGVAKRKNITLIEAARTMLADSKLPTTFWAEALNTACYVQNRVLVIKPHNKTPYEPFLGRKHALSFMKPFGCPVTILNTLDHLGKFDGKADEGFFVRYSTNSKAFRVFNSRTKIVEETMHIIFLENKPNVAGSVPTWLFDIDTLVKSMKYKPVVAGNQTNGNAGTKENIDAGQAGKKTIPDQKYILLPLWTKDPLFSFISNESPDVGFKPSGGEDKTDAECSRNEVNKVLRQDDQEKVDINNTVSAASTNEVNVVEADMMNLDSNIIVSLIPTTKIHKDHPVEQIIRDLHSIPQTRRMTKCVTKHVEPKKLIQALKDPSWIEAMQEELLQFKLQQVNEARGAKDTLGSLFWGVMHKRFGVITLWDICYDLKSLLSHPSDQVLKALKPKIEKKETATLHPVTFVTTLNKQENHVGIKSLHEVFAAELVLLMYKVTTVLNKVNAASSRVTTVDRVTTAG